MMTKFSKQKLAEAPEKKTRGGLTSDLLARKCLKVRNASKDNPVVTPPFAHSPAKHPAFPTSSLEVIASAKEGTKKKKVTFWDNADADALKAHKPLSMEDLNPFMVKLSSEVMSSHIQKLVQVYFDIVGYLFGLGFFLSLCFD